MPNPLHAQRLRAFAPTQERARERAAVPTVQQNGTTATVRLYDAIDDWGEWFGISSREFVEAIDGLPSEVETIDVRVNSPGGIVFEGLAIMNVLRAHSARVVATVEGLAASAASFIAIAADELVMMPNSELMIHDAWAMAVGDPAELREMADHLDHLSDNMATVYQAKAGGTVEEWRERMRAETWYSAQEAVDIGLADRVGGASMESNETASAKFDLSIFKYSGRAEAPEPRTAPELDAQQDVDEAQRRRARQLALLGL